LPTPLDQAVAHVELLNLDGSIASESDEKISVAESSAVTIGMLELPPNISNVHFLKLNLTSSAGKPLSTNFYWLQGPENNGDDLTDLGKLPEVTLQPQVARTDVGGKTFITVTLHNDSRSVALMAHVQLRRKTTDKRVLPVFYDGNYISLTPGEMRVVHIQADTKDLHGEPALVMVDGWNVTVKQATAPGVSIAPNIEADPAHWPVTNLPFQSVALR
jgi:Exo-beta-D-glucosaminidase Ig-fold domain